MQAPSNKRAFEVFDALFGDGGNIEAAGNFLPQPLAEKERHLAVALPLFGVHRLGGQPERVGDARLDFDETISIALFCEDVRLAEGRAEIALQNTIAALFEVRNGQGLSFPSQNFVTKVLRWIGHMPTSRMALMCAAVP